MPTCWIVAGPNGGGKTTFAMTYLPAVAQCQRFINADLIAAGLSPLAPEKELVSASRIFLCEIDSFEQQGDQRNVVNAEYYQLLLQESES